MFVRATIVEGVNPAGLLAPEAGRQPRPEGPAHGAGRQRKGRGRAAPASSRGDGREQVAGHGGAQSPATGVIVEGSQSVEPGAHGPRRRRRQRAIGRGALLSRFFIERPIFATVIAIVIMVAGALAIRTLPIEQYPTIAPPSVGIFTNYPGASAATVETSVTQVIEQQLTGLDHLLYFSSIEQLGRRRADPGDVRAGDQSRHRPGAGAEQAAVGAAAAAGAGDPGGHRRRQGAGRFPDGRRPLRHHRALQLDRHRRLPQKLSRRPAGADQRRRQRAGVRRPVRDPHLARSLQAAGIRPDAVGRAKRRAGAERPGDRRRGRRTALAAWAGAERDRHRPVAADQPRPVQGDHPEDPAGRIDRAARRTSRGSSSARTTTRPPRA